MRKVIKCMWPLLCILSVTVGCTGENNSQCITQNTTLLFRLVDPHYGNDIFLDNIHSVDAYIFDESKLLTEHRRFESDELAEFPGWKLDLPPGDYYAVCWGNADANSRLRTLDPAIGTFDEGFIEIPPNITTTGNPLYYAPYVAYQGSLAPVAFQRSLAPAAATRALPEEMKPYAFTVLYQRNNVKEMDFISAHRTINVYITGYVDSPLPTVTGTHLCSEYDFYFHSLDEYHDFTQTAKKVTAPNGQPALLATFYVCYSDITDDMNFTIQGANGEVFEPVVNLQQFIRDNNLTNTDTIDILYQFFEYGATITIPGWDEHPVIPGGEW